MADQQRYAPQVPGLVALRLGHPVIDELSLKDADIGRAIEVIAQKSGLNIVLGKDVTGKVSVFLKHVDAREALRIVLDSCGLASEESDGIIRVMTAGEFSARKGYDYGQEKASKLIRLNFIMPHDVAKLLEEMKGPHGKIVADDAAGTVLLIDSAEKTRAMEKLIAEMDVKLTTARLTLKNVPVESLLPEVRRLLTQSVGTVQADSAANALTVTDTIERVEKVRKAVAVLDAHGRTLRLEAKLVRIVLNDQHPEGVDWAGIVEDLQRLRLPEKYDFLAAPDSKHGLSLGMISDSDFATLIEALDTVGIVQEYPLSSVRVSGEDRVHMVVRLDDPGVELSLLPEEGNDDRTEAAPPGGASLSFIVKPVFDVTGDIVTTLTPQSHMPAAMAVPHPRSLSAREGYTAVLGGMVVSERVSKTHKIPLLGDLPLVGFAFRIDGVVRKEEYVVFLTPKSVSLSQILTGDDPAAAAGSVEEE